MRTLEDINAELEQVRQKLDRARKLSAVMEDLKAQHEERKRAAEDALKVLYREQEDVEELERLSFASFLARIRGEQAERLDQERREAVAAKARYDAARRDLEDLEARFQAAQKERAGLEGLRGRWKALMEEKEELLCQAAEGAKRRVRVPFCRCSGEGTSSCSGGRLGGKPSRSRHSPSIRASRKILQSLLARQNAWRYQQPDLNTSLPGSTLRRVRVPEEA